jgi:hypothetical protein
MTSITDLCDGYIAMYAECFGPWRDLRHGGAMPEADALVASQDPLHRIALELRAVCLADPAAAETWRQESMRDQVEGDLRLERTLEGTRSKGPRDELRGAWNDARIRIVEQREALAVGLGWPHRGERVVIDAERSSSGLTTRVCGPGVYLDSNDTYNVGHVVWPLSPGQPAEHPTLLVLWKPPPGAAQPECAHPGGDIGFRVAGAEDRRLPVPLPRWPKAAHIEGGPRVSETVPPGGQYELFAGWEFRK